MQCDYCESREYIFIGYREKTGFPSIKKEDFGLYRCKCCDLEFTYPRYDTEKFFRDAYHNERYGERTLKQMMESFPSPMLKRIKMAIRRTYRKTYIERLICRLLKDPTVLEVGCGISPFFIGKEYLAIEPHKETVEIFKQKGYANIIEGWAEELPPKCFDVILFHKTLGSVRDLRKVFKECRKGRYIVIVNDNTMNIYSSYNFSARFLSQIEGFELISYDKYMNVAVLENKDYFEKSHVLDSEKVKQWQI